jgi:hypothetical protein
MRESRQMTRHRKPTTPMAANEKGRQHDAAAPILGALKKYQSFENSCSTYSQLIRWSTNAFR